MCVYIQAEDRILSTPPERRQFLSNYPYAIISSNLTVFSVQRDDRGKYTCTAATGTSKSNADAPLEVFGRPIF